MTIDRLSRRSVRRLAESYIGLFGERDVVTNEREMLQDVRQTVGLVWVLSQSGQEDFELTDSRALQVESILRVNQAIELLELTPLEIGTAQINFLRMIKPDQVPEDQFINFFETFAFDQQSVSNDHSLVVLNR